MLRDHFSPLRWTEIPEGERYQANNITMPCIITNNEKFNEGDSGCYFRRNKSGAREQAEFSLECWVRGACEMVSTYCIIKRILIRNQAQQVRKLAFVTSEFLLSDNLIEWRVAKDTKFPWAIVKQLY